MIFVRNIHLFRDGFEIGMFDISEYFNISSSRFTFYYENFLKQNLQIYLKNKINIYFIFEFKNIEIVKIKNIILLFFFEIFNLNILKFFVKKDDLLILTKKDLLYNYILNKIEFLQKDVDKINIIYNRKYLVNYNNFVINVDDIDEIVILNFYFDYNINCYCLIYEDYNIDLIYIKSKLNHIVTKIINNNFNSKFHREFKFKIIIFYELIFLIFCLVFNINLSNSFNYNEIDIFEIIYINLNIIINEKRVILFLFLEYMCRYLFHKKIYIKIKYVLNKIISNFLNNESYLKIFFIKYFNIKIFNYIKFLFKDNILDISLYFKYLNIGLSEINLNIIINNSRMLFYNIEIKRYLKFNYNFIYLFLVYFFYYSFIFSVIYANFNILDNFIKKEDLVINVPVMFKVTTLEPLKKAYKEKRLSTRKFNKLVKNKQKYLLNDKSMIIEFVNNSFKPI